MYIYKENNMPLQLYPNIQLQGVPYFMYLERKMSLKTAAF